MIGQKSYIATPKNIAHKWHVIDASGRPLGRVATEAASILRGKNKPEFTPNAKCGDYVVIINCAKAILTGDKLVKKEWIRHTGWIGGIKRVQYKHLMENRPEYAMKMAVEGMLPHTTLGREQLTMLRVYAGEEHEHEAQVNAGTAKKSAKKTPVKKSESKKEPKVEVTVGADDLGRSVAPSETTEHTSDVENAAPIDLAFSDMAEPNENPKPTIETEPSIEEEAK